jgi:predicted AAA+ superfamily ATPase
VQITGPICCGKTYIVEQFLEDYSPEEVLRANGSDITSRIFIMNNDQRALIKWAEGKKVLFIDDAHRIPRVQNSIDILIEHNTEILIIVAYSTRALENIKHVRVYPVAISELRQLYKSTPTKDLLEDILIYGSLPSVLSSQSNMEKRDVLIDTVNKYMLRDVFELEKISNSKAVMDLLYFLALNINRSCSITDISSQLGINPRTTGRYIEILKRYYIIHEHKGYRNKMQSEVTKFSKFYFYDIGIRNALINNLNPLNMRNDIDLIWANFLIIERHKHQELSGISHSQDLESYYWATWEKKEIDLIEVPLYDLHAKELKAFKFDCKGTSNHHSKTSSHFLRTYPDAHFEVISLDNFHNFIKDDLRLTSE